MHVEPEADLPHDLDAKVRARRDALRKIAVFGAYTTPLMLGALASTKAVAQSTGGGGAGGGCIRGACSNV